MTVLKGWSRGKENPSPPCCRENSFQEARRLNSHPQCLVPGAGAAARASARFRESCSAEAAGAQAAAAVEIRLPEHKPTAAAAASSLLASPFQAPSSLPAVSPISRS